jgi:predicted kinase
MPILVLVSGWTGAGKSTIAELIAAELAAPIASFDWLMSGLRTFPEVWEAVERPVERQREVGWSLISRVAEQQLRRGASCVIDLVAREAPRARWAELASNHGAAFRVIECVCSDIELHRSRVDGRVRAIPGWYELEWEHVQRGRAGYVPLAEPKLVIDSVRPLEENWRQVLELISGATPGGGGPPTRR